jgi:tetratricopeptide (TPR) repeat protein
MIRMDSVFHRIRLVILVLVLAGCAAAPGTRIDNVPMYGQPQTPRPPFLKDADETFINQAVAGLGSREVASKAWAAQADKFMAENNLDFAMRRYNQSWLLNPNNYQPYWGFGRVMLEWGKVDESIEHFEKAKLLIDDDYQKVAFLADMATAYSVKATRTPSDQATERVKYFAEANKLYGESIAMDPKYANAWRSWARSLYFEGRYAEAWEKVNKAKTLGAPAFPPAFLKALDEKLPEPK